MNYLALALENPLTGSGSRVIGERIASGQLEPWNVHAHNVVLDAMGRYGLIVGALVLAVIGGTVAVGMRGALLGDARSLSLGASIAAMGLLDLPHGGWVYPGIHFGCGSSSLYFWQVKGCQ